MIQAEILRMTQALGFPLAPSFRSNLDFGKWFCGKVTHPQASSFPRLSLTAHLRIFRLISYDVSKTTRDQFSYFGGRQHWL